MAGQSDEEHRRDERTHWRSQSRLAILSVILSALAAGGAFVSIYLVAQALVVSQRGMAAARNAADQAKHQADAAEQQLALAKLAYESAQIPNISAGFQAATTVNTTAGKKGFLKLDIRNAGPGLAYKVVVNATVRILKYPVNSDDDLPGLKKPTDPPEANQGITLSPGPQAYSANDVYTKDVLTADDVGKICESCEYRLYGYGDVTFSDSLGNHYEQEFCGFLGNSATPGANYSVGLGVRNVLFCEVHNGQRRLGQAIPEK